MTGGGSADSSAHQSIAPESRQKSTSDVRAASQYARHAPPTRAAIAALAR